MRYVLAAAILACLTLAAPHPAPAADWPQFQHDTRHTGAAAETLRPPMRIRWMWNTDPASAVRIGRMVQPIVADGRVFLGLADGRFYALDERTGRESWSARTGGPILGTAAWADGRVYVGSQDGRLYAFDAATGELAWSFDTGAGVWAAPCVAEGKVFVGSRSGYFYALDAATGQKLWQYPREGPTFLPPILTPAAYADGVLYFGQESLHAVALRAADGEELWRTRLFGQSFHDTWPVVSGDKVIFRTVPAYGFHNTLHRAGDVFRVVAEGADVAAEQEAMRRFLAEDPHRQSFFVLDRADGGIPYVAPVPAICMGGGSAPMMPVVPRDGEAVTLVLSRRGPGGGVSLAIGGNVARLDLADGSTQLISTDPRDHTVPAVDEGGGMSLAGEVCYVTHTGNLGGITLDGREFFKVIREQRTMADGWQLPTNLWLIERGADSSYSSNVSREHPWHWAPPLAGATVANGTLYWISDGGILAALEPAAAGEAFAGPPAGQTPEPLDASPHRPAAAPARDLETYVWADRPRGTREQADPRLRRLAEEEVARFLSAEEFLAPAHVRNGIQLHEPPHGTAIFHEPHETLAALSSVYRYLPDEQQQALRTYLRRFIARNPPWRLYIGFDQGTRREYYPLPPDVKPWTGGRETPNPAAFYAVWLYASETGDWTIVQQAWPQLARMFEDVATAPPDTYAAIGGFIGFARLARQLGHEDLARRSADLAVQGMQAGRDFAAWNEAAYQANRRAHEIKVPVFEGLTPEVGLYLREVVGAPVFAEIDRLTTPRPRDLGREDAGRGGQLVVWWPARVERMCNWNNAEISEYRPSVARSLFATKAYVMGEPAERLRGYLDVPFCAGDLYFLEKLSAVLGAGAAD